MNNYEAKRQARIDRLKARADRQTRVAATLHERAKAMADIIPMGQPIMVGHYSEGRDRNYRARIDRTFTKSMEASKDAQELARRADAAENNEAVSSDDPDAIVKLRAKLAEEEAGHESMKADLTRARKLLKSELKDEGRVQQAKSLRERGIHPSLARHVEFMGSLPTLGNSSANLRRLRERTQELEQRATAPTPEEEQIGEARLVEEENRVRLYFPQKPSEEHRKILKYWGFRWSPMAGAWQRHANFQGWTAARLAAKAIAGCQIKTPSSVVGS